jgi:hypothetical protein
LQSSGAGVSKGVVVVPEDERPRPGAEAIRFDLVLESTGLVAWEWDLVTGGVRTAGDLETILGVAPGALGHGWEAVLAVVHADDRQALADWLETRRRGGPETSLDFRVANPAGEARWGVVRGRTYRDGEGRPSRVVGVLGDVTERRHQQEEERRSQRFLDSVIEHIPAMVFVKDAAELRFVLVNRAGEELLGYPGAELVGRNDHDLFAAEEADVLAATDREVLQSGEVRDVPVKAVHTRHRGTRLLHTKRIPICDDDGRPQFLLGISEDVTERVEAEAALAEAQQEAERVSRAKTDFLSRMSHELRTPLNAILGFAQVLELDELGDDHRRSVEQILRAGRHLLDLINEVLDISRIESGRLALSLEPVEVGEVVEEALDLIRPIAAGQSITLPATLPAACAGHVRADRQRLKQVLLNLLANAVKFNRHGGRVTVDCEVAGTGRLRLAVGDTGPGISEAQRPLLFSPFERLGADQWGVEGTGLGLALAKGLVEAMGGAIGVDSAPGQGSVFWVELDSLEAPPGGPDRRPRHRAPPAEDPGVTRTVLYVEDNPSNVALVQHVLARRPEVRLLVAVEGGAGMALAKEHQPDLVLLDMHLPDLSGEVVLQRLRAEPRTRDVPVVMLSADATPSQVKRLLAAGAADYLTKPFDIAHLLSLVDGLAGTGAAPAPGTTAPAAEEEGTLDRSVLDSLRFLDDTPPGNRLAQLVALYLEDTATRLGELREALTGKDAAAVNHFAHNVKGTSATYGAARLARLCGELEQVAGDGDVAASSELLAGIEEEFERVGVALRREFPELAG